MKILNYLIISILLFSITNISYSKEISKSKVPKVIVKSFEKEFPNIKNEYYNFEKEGKKKIYQISYEKDNKFYIVLYNTDGSQIQSEEAISPGDLIDPIISYLMKNYMKFNINRASKIYKNHAFYGYNVELDLGRRPTGIEFDKDGHFVREH